MESTIAGTALGIMNGGGIGNLFGNNNCNRNNNCCTGGWNGGFMYGGCSENTVATRFDIEQAEKFSAKDAEIAYLRGQNQTNDKIVDLADRVSTRFNALEKRVSDLEVYAAVNTTKIGCMAEQIAQLQSLAVYRIPCENVITGNACPVPAPATR